MPDVKTGPIPVTFVNAGSTAFTTGVPVGGEEEPGESEELGEVMPLHRKLGIHFLPDYGVQLRSFVANMSAVGLQAHYSVEEMEKHTPTPWRTFWNSSSCVEKREEQKKDRYFMACSSVSPVIWTPKHKLAYMKTPKAASTAFESFFREHFADSVQVQARELPRDAYVFTFARQPFRHKLAAFAEVGMKTMEGLEMVLDRNTTFQHVLPIRDQGRSRFAAFLDDVLYRRFQPGDARKPEHAKNQVGSALCTHSVNFFGHLERLTADWDQIQAEARLPQELRTKALPVVHAETSTQYAHYRHDESIPLTKSLKEKMCKIYSSEFACLGYDAPPGCRKYGLP